MANQRDPHEIEDPDDLQDADEGIDAGQIDDEGGDASQAGQESQVDETQERVSRRDDRIREELRAVREHNARVEQELQQLRQERQQAQQPQGENDAQFEARVALLDPEDRWNAKFQRAQQRNNQQIALATFAAADRADKAAFDSKAAHDPIYRKYAQEVEQVLQIERRKGRDFDRETVLDFVRGRSARMRQAKPAPGQERGRETVRPPQTRTTGGRGDQVREQRSRRYAANDMSPEAVRQRLEAPDAFI